MMQEMHADLSLRYLFARFVITWTLYSTLNCGVVYYGVSERPELVLTQCICVIWAKLPEINKLMDG